MGQLMRTLGFAKAPGVLRIFGGLPNIGPIVLGVVSVWMLIAMVIAVRQALDFTTTWRAAVVCLVAWLATASHGGSDASNDPRRTRAWVPNRLSRRRAWASISGSMSRASTAPTRSYASNASAKAPVPVPRSSTRVGRAPVISFAASGQGLFVAWDERADGRIARITFKAKMIADDVAHPLIVGRGVIDAHVQSFNSGYESLQHRENALVVPAPQQAGPPTSRSRARVRSVLTTAVTVSSSFAGDTLGVYRPLGAEVVLHTAAGSAGIGASVAASW